MAGKEILSRPLLRQVDMTEKLKKQYFIFLMPAVGLYICLGLARQFHMIRPGLFTPSPFLATGVFILSAVTALAGPVLCRASFAHAVRGEKRISPARFLSFERSILWISQVTPYFGFLAVLCEFPAFYAAGILLMTLYSVYYYFPSAFRVNHDRRIFRVR